MKYKVNQSYLIFGMNSGSKATSQLYMHFELLLGKWGQRVPRGDCIN